MNNSLRSDIDFSKRANTIDHARLTERYYLGNYQVRLPVSINRMMENAHDWEHLPYVHASTFGSIKLFEAGDWGWRVEVTPPRGKRGDNNILETLIDNDNKCWATLVLSGYGEGVEIHSQATEVSANQVDVNVRFFAPQKPGWLKRTLGRYLLKRQYKALYQEDRELMLGRQAALDDRRAWTRAESASGQLILIGALDQLSRETSHLIELSDGRFCVRYFQQRWVVYSAVCPHQLGNLDHALPDEHGTISCPWHGYRFSILNGNSVDRQCASLASPPELLERDNKLYLRTPDHTPD